MSSDSDPRELATPAEGESPKGAGEAAVSEPVEVPREAPGSALRLNALIFSFLTLWLIVAVVWLVSAGSRYREEYSQSQEGWRIGSTRSVELTLVPQDKTNLGCASDQVVQGLRCGFRRCGAEAVPPSPEVLQPLNTVGNELLLGAGLWAGRDMKGSLPPHRFTVVCNYNIKGVMKSVAIRFDPAAAFSPVGRTVTLGTLTDCVIPR
jgi:hypothetical protein